MLIIFNLLTAFFPYMYSLDHIRQKLVKWRIKLRISLNLLRVFLCC